MNDVWLSYRGYVLDAQGLPWSDWEVAGKPWRPRTIVRVLRGSFQRKTDKRRLRWAGVLRRW